MPYTRVYTHQDWTDNVDRVQAGGDHGFNAEFRNIEAEFDAVSSAISGLASRPTTYTVTLTPNLIMLDPAPDHQFVNAEGAVQVKLKQLGATAMQSVQFPPGATVSALRTTGAKSNGNFQVILKRQLLEYGSQPEPVLTATVTPTQNGPFDARAATAARTDLTIVDSSRYRYYLYVEYSGGDANATSGIDGGSKSLIVNSFQIAYTPTVG